MKKFDAEEFPPRLAKLADELKQIIADMKYNREYPILFPDSPIMYIGGNLENVERNIRLAYFYFTALCRLRK